MRPNKSDLKIKKKKIESGCKYVMIISAQRMIKT